MKMRVARIINQPTMTCSREGDSKKGPGRYDPTLKGESLKVPLGEQHALDPLKRHRHGGDGHESAANGNKG